MARKNTGNPVGAPPKEIDWKYFEQLCGLYCTTEEISSYFGVHKDTLRKKAIEQYGGDDYSSIYKRFFDAGTPSLRRDRRVLAKKNAAMSIWLGKMHLGERDTPEDPNAKNIETLLRMLADNLVKQGDKPSNE